MKRMHALPIELPLVASGEFASADGKFILDKPLKEGKNYLVLIDNIYEDNLTTINMYLPKLNELTRYSQSSLFQLQTLLGHKICFLRHEYDETNSYQFLSLYMIDYFNDKNSIALLVDYFDDDNINPPVIYIYEISNEPSMIP